MSIQRLTRICPKCGTEFTTILLNQKYCDGCREKRKPKKLSKTFNVCQECGRKFRPRTIHQKFCDDCRVHRKKPKPKDRTCALCGKVFKVWDSKKMYCDDCRANRPKEIRSQIYARCCKKKEQVCPICGLTFKPTNNNQRYCYTCRTCRKSEIQAYQEKNRAELNYRIELVERQSAPKTFPSIQDILRKNEELCEKTGTTYIKPYDYGKYVFLQSIGRVP